MTTQQSTSAPSGAERVLPAHWPDVNERPPLERLPRAGWLGGVCAGIARHLGVSAWGVRGVVIVTSLVWVGLPVYLFLWFSMPRAEQAGRTPRPRLLLASGFLIVTLVGALLADTSGVSVQLGIPLLVSSAGLVIAWSRLADRDRRAWVSSDFGRRESLLRLSFGAFLVLVGLVTAAATGRGFAGLRDVGIALVVLLGGLAAVLAPFGLRLWDDMRRDQAEKAMADARADVASHLHDSVLQTLALIQRRTNEPEIAQLARTQERDLRSWLFADDENAPEVAEAPELLRGVVHAVEDGFAVPVDVIVTGQAPVTPRIEALVSAVREATTNAAKHGAPPVSVYAEFNADVAEVFVRDHGEGFDPDAVAEDRAGVRESIVGRMERHGGSARIRRLDDGLEVSLTMPLEERS
ncbi:PspC domain-containing protein [Dermacoccus abyssi]|uniref:PspC domain-containing protein n=1 Tax=Dermacoccus abyssi TaxID=322596 RepID=UPI002AD1F7CA|nr:PspC domain-containing protein [Dermacoccus abyssi]